MEMALLVYSVKKQFNTSASLGQYEFLAKWYSAKRDTWELITNIPDAVLNKFEQEKQTQALTHPPARPGLCDRQSIKPKDPNFISNA